MENRSIAVRTGYLLPGGEPVGIGATRPVKAIASTALGEIAVIAKRLPLREVAVETICAVFGRIAGLPIPEPILLKDENHQWLYGSIYEDHPNFSQYVSLSEPAVSHELAKWSKLSGAACFDEAIANPDRNDENLLYDGLDFMLIDHDMCLPSGMPVIDHTEDYYTNRLLEIRLQDCEGDNHAKTQAFDELCAWAEGIPSDYLSRALCETSDAIDAKTLEDLSQFLEQRINILAELLEKKIEPIMQQRLSIHAGH